MAEGGGATSGVMTAERRCDLKGASRNAIVLSVAMLDDIQNLMICRSILATSSVLKRWHSEQVRTARSCEGCFKWLSDQLVNGHLMQNLMDMWSVWDSPVELQKVGFIQDQQAAKLAASHGEYVMQDEVAEYFGSFSVYTIEARLKRMIYLWGPPHNLLMVQSKDAKVASHWCSLFRQDVRGFRQLQQKEQKSAMMQQVLRTFSLSFKCCMQCLIHFQSSFMFTIHNSFSHTHSSLRNSQHTGDMSCRGSLCSRWPMPWRSSPTSLLQRSISFWQGGTMALAALWQLKR